MKTLASVARGVAWRTLHNVFTNPSLLHPVARLPALLLHRVRRRALADRATCPASTTRPGTPRSSSCSCCCSRPRSAACSPASGSRATSRAASRGGCMLAAPHRSGIVLGYALAALVRWVVTAARADRGRARGRDERRRRRRRPARPLRARGDHERRRRCSGRAGVAMRFRTMQAGPVMQMPGLPRALLRARVRAADAAHGLDPRGRDVVNPVTRVLEAGRGFLAGSPTEVGFAFAAALALVLRFALWALRGLRKAEAAG